jgi:dTDP-4-amino-4,6-dideoxygalactose transaminase
VHALIGGDRETPWGRDFDLGNPGTPASRLTTALVPRLADPGAADARRAHYRFLLERLGDGVSPLFASVPDGAAPIAFLFRSTPDEQRRLRLELAARGVVLANFWMAPHGSVPDHGFEQAQALRADVVGLPVHQELRDVDLERIVEAVRAVQRVT